MPNLWNNLPPLNSPSYVLSEDENYVTTYNNRIAKSKETKIVIDQIPEPWLGDVNNAPLVVLQLNPHYLSGEVVNRGKHPVVGQLNLAHYGLTSKDKWWLSCFKTLAEDVGSKISPHEKKTLQRENGYKHLESRVCSIEYIAYGSEKFDQVGHTALRLPSQDFSFDLVRGAITRGAYIAILKGCKQWLGAVPELNDYPKVACLTGARGAKTITRNNCPTGQPNSLNNFYDHVLEKLCERATFSVCS